MDLLSGLGDIAVVGPASAACSSASHGSARGGRRRRSSWRSLACDGACARRQAGLRRLRPSVALRHRESERPRGARRGVLGLRVVGAAPAAGRPASGWRSTAPPPASALAVAYSRVALGAHTVAEVVCGLAIGARRDGSVRRAARPAAPPAAHAAEVAARASPIAVLLAVDLGAVHRSLDRRAVDRSPRPPRSASRSSSAADPRRRSELDRRRRAPGSRPSRRRAWSAKARIVVGFAMDQDGAFGVRFAHARRAVRPGRRGRRSR